MAHPSGLLRTYPNPTLRVPHPFRALCGKGGIANRSDSDSVLENAVCDGNPRRNGGHDTSFAMSTYRFKLSRPGWQNEISQADLQLPPRVLSCVLVGLFLDLSALLEELEIYLGIGEYSKSAMIEHHHVVSVRLIDRNACADSTNSGCFLQIKHRLCRAKWIIELHFLWDVPAPSRR